MQTVRRWLLTGNQEELIEWKDLFSRRGQNVYLKMWIGQENKVQDGKKLEQRDSFNCVSEWSGTCIWELLCIYFICENTFIGYVYCIPYKLLSVLIWVKNKVLVLVFFFFRNENWQRGARVNA